MQNSLNRMKTPGCVETQAIQKALQEVEENGSFWPGLLIIAHSTMDVIGKVFLETTSMS